MSRPKPDHHSRNTGPLKPTGIKSTAKEVTNRLDEVTDYLCSGYRRNEITDKMCAKYGIHWRTVDRYMVRAREILMEELGKPKDEHRSDVLGEYQQILHTEDATHSDKLQALKGKREMLGLDAPKRTELSGPDGGPIATKEENPLKGVPVPRLRQLALGRIDATQEEKETVQNGEARNGH